MSYKSKNQNDKDELEKELEQDDSSSSIRDDETLSGIRPRTAKDDNRVLTFDDNSLDDPSRTPIDPNKDTENLSYIQPEPKEDNTINEKEASDENPSPEIGKTVDEIQEKSISPLDQYKNYLQQYQALQEQRRKSDLVAGLAAAGGKIGQSMAGKYSGQFNPDMTGVKVLQDMANRPVTDFEQGQIVQGRGIQLQSQMAAADPDSQQSKLVRNYLNEKILKPANIPLLGSKVSANDAMLLMKTVGKPGQTKFGQQPMVNQKTGEKSMAIFNPTTGTFSDVAGNPMGSEWVRDYRAQSFVDPASQERLGFSGGTGKVTGPLTGPGINRPSEPAAAAGESTELNRGLLTAQQSKQLDHVRDKFLTEVKNDRSAINSADRVLQVLTSGQSVGDLPAEVQDQMSRAFGQTGHITDAQMGRALGRSDWKSRLNLAKSMMFEGKIDDENRQFLMDVMKVIKDQNQQFVSNKAKVYSENLSNDFKSSANLKKYNVTPDSINKLLGVEAASSSQQEVKKDPKIQKFAEEHTDGNYEKAKAILIKRGYKSQE